MKKISILDIPDESGTTFAQLNAFTSADAKDVVQRAFGGDAVGLIDKILANPILRKSSNISQGDVVYFNGRPVAFEGAIVRKLYWRNSEIIGVVGSTMGLVPGTSPLALLSLMRRNLASRFGSVLWFANTANAASIRMNRQLGVDGIGPKTWDTFSYSIIHPIRFIREFLQRTILKRASDPAIVYAPLGEEVVEKANGLVVRRLKAIPKISVDSFWNRYLAKNNGLVLSRTGEELAWLFGKNISCGHDVFLGAFRGSDLVGYIIIRSEANGWWRVVDLIGEDNSPQIVVILSKSAKKFLRKRTDAALLRVLGFSNYARKLIAREFPLSHYVGGNPFLWHFTDERVAANVGDMSASENGWFFGPYDGDWCL